MGRKLKIGIVGAGIGGMTAAVALQQRGFHAVVYEQAPELGEIGAGLTISPNATRVLAGLGLEDEIETLASASPHIGTMDYKTGEPLAYVSRGADEYLKLYGAVVRHMHRADIHGVLVRAFDASGDCLRLGQQLVDIEQDDNQVRLGFANGQSDFCDVVVACDGLKSTVRDQLFPTEPPRFTGFVAWRGVVERARVPTVNLDPHFASYRCEAQSFGRYPLRHATLINYVAMAHNPHFQLESWSARADVSEVLALYEDWYTDVVEIIRATPPGGCLRWALHSRQPLDSWVNGRVTLLGDAAHPMTPFLGMGAVMAFEDAAVLARCFEAAGDDWRDALQRYERARLSRANKIHTDSLKRGESALGGDPNARARPVGEGLDEVYMYDAMTVPV